MKPKCYHSCLEHLGGGWYRCMDCDKWLDKDHRDPSIDVIPDIQQILIKSLEKET